MKALFLFTLLFTAVSGFAQHVAINTTGDPADPSAVLDLSSTQAGLLIPRMESGKRMAINAPAQGLLVFDTDSRSFWFYSNGWNELVPGGVSGIAGGDLSGVYPDPQVVKIQQHDVSPTLPTEGQVLKWYGPNQRWQPLRDSLALPYTATDAGAGSLFSVTNTWNGFGYNTSILGRRIDPSGIPLTFSTAIWGDAFVGTGILGTSNFHPGVYGASLQHHGVEGHAAASQRAGVYGTSTSGSEGIGVLGEVSTPGVAVYGKAMHNTAIAGRFESTLATTLYPTLVTTNFGMGASATFTTGNPSNTNATVYVNTFSQGNGIYAFHDSIGTDNAAIKALHNGSGQGLYGKSVKGDAGQLVIDNLFSHGNALHASTIGDGGAGVFLKTHVFGEQTGSPAVLIENYSRASGLKVRSLFPSALTAGIEVEYEGYGFGIDVTSAKGGLRAVASNENSFGVFATNTAENSTAIRGSATAFGSNAIHGSADGFFGIGVYGTTTHPWGIAIKGESSSENKGAIEGNNSGGGGGVIGNNSASFGYGIIGNSGPQHGIAGKFTSNNSTSAISPAIWALVQSLSNGIEVTVVNGDNAKDAVYVNHHGTGNMGHFVSSAGADIALSNNGNINTTGAVTVRGNKGILRNSGSGQMRYESKVSGTLSSAGAGIGVVGTLNVTFATAFSSTPVVTVANVENITGSIGDKLVANISAVSTTGCTITIINPYISATGPFSAKWTVMAVGAE